MKTKKTLALLLACAIGITAFSGCRSGSDRKATTDDGKTLISVGLWPDKEAEPKSYERMEKMRRDFMEKYPDIYIQEDNWKFDVQSFTAKAEGGTLPTVYKAYFTEANRIMELGYAADITDAIKEHGYYDKINDYLLRNISKNDKIYLIPSEMYTLGLLININLFRDAGLIDSDGSPVIPKTFDELRQISKTITEKTGKAGFVLPTAENVGGWNFMPLAWSYGTTFMEQKDGKWISTFASDECTSALKLIHDMKWEDNSLPPNTKINAEEVMKLIGTDQAAMTFAHPGQLNSLVNSYGMDINAIGMAKMPAGPVKNVTLMGGAFYVIEPNATPEQIDAALKWIEFNGITPDLDDEGKARYRETYEKKKEQGADVIGIKDLTLWNEKASSQAYKDEVKEEFRNIPKKNIESYNNKQEIEFQAEEPVCAQDLYATLDRCIQEVLTNESSDCAGILKQASEDFQANFLDYENN